MNGCKKRNFDDEHIAIKTLSNDLIEECKRATEDSFLSNQLREELQRLPRQTRNAVVHRVRNGCPPLFIACKRGCFKIVHYLIKVCEANIEQRGVFEFAEDRSLHVVTPLWCAAVSGKLYIVKYLIRIGCDINAASDSGSTPVRSACYMKQIDIVKYLVENGADIYKSNINNSTCLINSVQSVELCEYLIQKGVDVNQKDIQNKTALHYAIQENRLDVVKLLIEKGADPFVKSRYGDDALQMACLKGNRLIFNYLKLKIPYSDERLADAYELIGTTLLDEMDDNSTCLELWRIAQSIRSKPDGSYIAKTPEIPRRQEYGNAVEFTTAEELDSIVNDINAMRIQSLLIYERILGINHKETLNRLIFRGASYAELLHFQKCIDLWKLALEIRIKEYSILFTDTCLSAEAIVHLMLFDNYNFDGVEYIPIFSDILAVFDLLTSDIINIQNQLQIRPIYKKQLENYDRILKCISHLIYLLLKTVQTFEERKILYDKIFELVNKNVRSAYTNDTLLHLCVSKLNVIKTNFLTHHSEAKAIFPDFDVVKLLIICGSDVNAKNESKSTPLHVVTLLYNFDNKIIRLLLDNGADLDQPNKNGERPINSLINNALSSIPLINFITLKCLSATVISKHRISYRNQVPKELEGFLKQHES